MKQKVIENEKYYIVHDVLVHVSTVLGEDLPLQVTSLFSDPDMMVVTASLLPNAYIVGNIEDEYKIQTLTAYRKYLRDKEEAALTVARNLGPKVAKVDRLIKERDK